MRTLATSRKTKSEFEPSVEESHEGTTIPIFVWRAECLRLHRPSRSSFERRFIRLFKKHEYLMVRLSLSKISILEFLWFNRCSTELRRIDNRWKTIRWWISLTALTLGRSTRGDLVVRGERCYHCPVTCRYHCYPHNSDRLSSFVVRWSLSTTHINYLGGHVVTGPPKYFFLSKGKLLWGVWGACLSLGRVWEGTSHNFF